MPRKDPPVQSERVTTRSTNVDKHPGIDALSALRTRRDPQVIQAEKEKKRENTEAKDRQKQEEFAKKEVAERDLEEFRAQQASNIDAVQIPRKQTGGNVFIILIPESHIGL
jgi:DNA-directed RNA polymerase alpha subunit